MANRKIVELRFPTPAEAQELAEQYNHLDAIGEIAIRANESIGNPVWQWVEGMGIEPMDEGSEEFAEYIKQLCQPTEAELRMQRYMQKNG